MSICNFGCFPFWGLKAGLYLVLIAPAPERCFPFTFCLNVIYATKNKKKILSLIVFSGSNSKDRTLV